MDRRIIEFRDAAAQMCAGRFDIDLSVSGNDEVAELGRALQELGGSLQRKFTELQTLFTLIERVNSGLLLDDVCNHLFETFRGIIPYNRIGVALLENGNTYVRARWARSDASEKKISLGYGAELKGSSLQTILETGKPRILNNLLDYAGSHPASQSTKLILEEGMRSSLTCPLVASAHPVGFMFFSSMEPNTYRDVHIEVFLNIAGQIATIIEKSRLYEQLLELNEVKNRFLGIAAHDLRSPLSIIRGYIKLLQSGICGTSPEAARQMLERMDYTCESMLSLINDLLDVSAIESGQLVLDLRTVHLGRYLRELYELNRLQAEGKSIRLQLELAPELPSIEVDSDRLGQAINNVIGNAIKFSPEHTDVVFGARTVDGAVEIYVQDHGPGIPEAEIGKIFTEFSKTSVKPTQGEKSTGLGLAIVKRMIEAHGGSIRVKSRVGEGSTFTLTLPLREPAASPPV